MSHRHSPVTLLSSLARVTGLLLATLLVVTTLAPTAQAAPAKKTLYARETQPIADHRYPSKSWRSELVIYGDGTWQSGAAAGVLTKNELRGLKSAIAKTRVRLDQRRGIAMCTGFPHTFVRITTKGQKVQWSAPCARGPDVTVLALEQLVTSLTTSREPPPVEPVPEPSPWVTVGRPSPTLVSYRVDIMSGSRSSETITIGVGGDWSTRSGGLLSEGKSASGVIDAVDVAKLRKLLAAVTWGPNPKRYECAARLDGQGSISAEGFGAYSWSVPCGQLHPTLSSLVSELRRLTKQ